MKHEFVIERDMRGALRAETRIYLEPVAGSDGEQPGVRELRVSTSKRYSGGVSSFACVGIARSGMTSHGGYDSFQTAIGLGGGGDYSKTLAHDRGMRATEKNIRAMHEAALAGIDAVVAECRALYEIMEAA